LLARWILEVRLQNRGWAISTVEMSNVTGRVLGLYGSPRRGGNSEILLDEFLRGCTDAGAQAERIVLAKLNMKGCLGCDGCEESGECVQKDDMESLYRSLEQHDRIVLASPIYFYGVTSQTKAVIDRSQALWCRKYRLQKSDQGRDQGRVRKGFFISVGATKGKNLFEGTILTIRYFFDAIDVEYSGELLYKKVDSKGAIRDHPTALKDCYEAGRAFVVT